MDNNCDNCKFTNYDAEDWPCDECVCCSNWESPRMLRQEMVAKLRNYCDHELDKYSHYEDCPGCVFNCLCNSTGVLDDFDDLPDGVLESAVKLIESPEPNDNLDEPTNDPVNHPNHYCQGGIECIDVMEAAFNKQTVADFCICNAFKYIFRYKNKNGVEDVKKARWYLDKYLKLYEEMM